MAIYRRAIGMRIGRDTMIWAGNMFNDPDNMSIGDNCIVGPQNVFLSRGGVHIGNNVNLSGFSFFLSQQHDVRDSNLMTTTLAPIIVEDDSWIATNATILPGVRIGRGAVVAASAVVTHDVAPFEIVGGNPAQRIGTRPPEIGYRLRDLTGIKWL
jgi:maltose O-acetyltransferase